MYDYNDDQFNELKEYHELFDKSLELKAVYLKVGLLLNKFEDITYINKNEILPIICEECSLPRGSIPKDTLYYWEKKYREKGIIGLLNAKVFVKSFLENCEVPIYDWSKRKLKRYLDKNTVEMHGISMQINLSETTYGNILRELRGKAKKNQTEQINKAYNKGKNKETEIFFVDYVKLPRNPFELSTKDQYIYIMVSKDDIILRKVIVDKGRKEKEGRKGSETVFPNKIVEGFEQVINYILKVSEYKNEEICFIFKNEPVNELIKKSFSKQNSSYQIMIGSISKLDSLIKSKFRIIDSIKNDIISNPDIMKTFVSRTTYSDERKKQMINKKLKK